MTNNEAIDMTNNEAIEIIMQIYEGQIKDKFKLIIKDETAIKIDCAFNMAKEALAKEI